jgi:hypothetical protein
VAPTTQLIVLRGNSGSGKTSVARALRQAYGRRGLALVSQDVLRRDDHPGRSHFFYFDIPFGETLRRHAGRPQSVEFGAEVMREWYVERDLLPGEYETVIHQDSSLQETVRHVLARTLGHSEYANDA